MQKLAAIGSAYNEITVYETSQLDGETSKFRCIRFADEDVQGAIDLRDRRRLVLGYQKAMTALMEHRDPDFRSAFIIGHGIGSISGYFRGKRIKTAEIDEAVVELSRRYFDCADDNVEIGDGRQLLEAEADRSLDFIVLDAFTSRGTPQHLTTVEFFRLAAKKLRLGGALLLNMMGRPQDDSMAEAIRSTLRRAFADVRCYSLSAPRERDRRNLIFVGSDASDGLDSREIGLREIELAEGYMMWDGSAAWR